MRLENLVNSLSLILGNYQNVQHQYLVEVSQPIFGKDCFFFYKEMTVCVVDKLIELNESTVVSIERDAEVRMFSECAPTQYYHLDYVTHNVDRQNQRVLEFAHQSLLPDTNVYVLDTWVDIDHPEFQGRARRGPAFVSGTKNFHGTHVAALIAGNSVGTNPNAHIISLQVLDDNGFGSWSVILKALEWLSKIEKPSIVNMSIGGPRSQTINKIVDLLSRKGWKIVAAAGNDGADACGVSPASAVSAVTVGSTNSQYQYSKFSNWGTCVDLAAPGEAIISAYPGGAYAMSSGTSMAAPIFAGIWSTFPVLGEKEVRQKLVVKGLLRSTPITTINKFANNGENNCAYVRSFLPLIYTV